MQMKKLFSIIFNINTIALFAATAVMAVIITTLHQGISCDEGFYLMGYLHKQPLGDFISDYANIVRSITPQSLDENIMIYRYERLIGFSVAITLFALSLYRWLKSRYNLSINPVLFGSLTLLAGAMSYIFAAPTISYDSIQTIIYLTAFALLFWAMTVDRLPAVCSLLLLLSGAVSFVGLLNYMPSGIFLIGVVTLWIIVDSEKEKSVKILSYFVGLVFGAIVYHLLITDLVEYAGTAVDTIIKVFTEQSASRHDSSGLILSFVVSVGIFALYIPIIAILTWIFRVVKLSKYVIYTIVGLVLMFLLVYRGIYNIYAPIFFAPIAVQIAWLLATNKWSLHSIWTNKKELFVIAILTILPFLGVFGTNQSLFTKMLIFIPFWLIVFFILYSKTENRQFKNIATILLIITMFAGYVYLGNFSRYHYYYTPRSSKYLLDKVHRPQRVTFSQYQKEYFEEVSDILHGFGAEKGDSYLAFGENQMTVFLMGGYIAGGLPYHWFQYKHFPKEQPKFFVLFKNEETEVIDLLKDTSWSFPENYVRTEIRPMSQNMDDEKLRTVIYALKQ